MKIKTHLFILILCFLSSKSLFSQIYTEDFADGLSGWTTIEVTGNGTSSAVWTHTSIGPDTGNGFDIAPLLSNTDDNGWVMFDSNLNCAGNQIGQNTWLISPTIDATDFSTVWLQFAMYYQNYWDRPQIRIGTDMNNLDSWEIIELFPDIGSNEFAPTNDQFANPQFLNLELTDYAANSVFRFAFQFLSDASAFDDDVPFGCAYAWEIDDILITSNNAANLNDLQITSTYAIAPNTVTPKSQIEPIPFLADISNVGANDVTNSVLDFIILDELGNTVFDDQLTYDNIIAGETAPVTFFDNMFTPPASTQYYQGIYQINPLDVIDEDPSNNEQSFRFEIGDTLFSKTNLITNAIAESSFSFGNIFYVPNGEGMFARYVAFGIDNIADLVGESLNIYLYQWAGDLNGDEQINQGEFLSTGGSIFQSITQYQIQGNEGTGLITIPIHADGIGVPLENDTYYFVCIEYTGNAIIELQTSIEYDYSAMQYITDSLNMPRYASAFDTDNTGTYALLQNIVPAINMSIGNNSDIFGAPLANENILLPENTVQISPNPVSEIANLQFDLKEKSKKVSLEIFNSMGELVHATTHTDIFKDKVRLDVKHLSSGNYVVKVHTDWGSRMMKLVLVH